MILPNGSFHTENRKAKRMKFVIQTGSDRLEIDKQKGQTTEIWLVKFT